MKHNLSDEVINRQAKFAYWAYQKALGNELPTLWDQGDKELTLRAAYPKGYSKDSPILTDAERAPWIAVANRLADSLVGMPIEPGSTATLFASGDFPATKIELVKMYEVQMGTVKFPDGTLREIPSTALIDWCSEWYKGDLTMHIDNFGERVPLEKGAPHESREGVLGDQVLRQGTKRVCPSPSRAASRSPGTARKARYRGDQWPAESLVR